MHSIGPGLVPSRLARKLGTTAAVVVGLGSMIVAGVFAVVGPAAAAAAAGLLLALAIAALWRGAPPHALQVTMVSRAASA